MTKTLPEIYIIHLNQELQPVKLIYAFNFTTCTYHDHLVNMDNIIDLEN